MPPFFAAGIWAGHCRGFAMMTCHDRASTLSRLPDNVIAFPGARRRRAAGAPPAGETARFSRHRGKQPVAISAAELNTRLLILFGICTTSAAIAVSSVHILLG